MTQNERAMITHGWAELNLRRGFLITIEVRGEPTPEESAELDELQRLADLRTDLLDPFEEVERSLASLPDR